ncbi:hypothetical protein [Thiolapillus sp.]
MLFLSLLYERLPAVFCAVFCFAALFSVASPSLAACVTDGAECPPETVTNDGAIVSRQYDLNFRTDNQALRHKGEAATGQNNKYHESADLVVLKRSETEFNGDLSIRSIRSFSLFDKLDDMLRGKELLGIEFSTVLSKLKKIFSNKTYKFGADMDVSMEGDYGLTVFGRWKEGSVDLRYPVAVSISYPDKSQFNAGNQILVKTSSTSRDGYNFITHSPGAELGLKLSGKLDTRGEAKSCNFSSCKNKTFWDIDIAGKRDMVVLDGEAGKEIDLSDTHLPFDLVNFFVGMTGQFSIPKIVITNEETEYVSVEDETKLALVGNDTDRFVHFIVDVDHWLLFGLTKIEKVTKYFGTAKQYAFKFVNFLFTLIDVRINTDLIQHQKLTFIPDTTIDFSFSSPVEWEVTKNGEALDSGNSASVTLIAGQDLRIQTTDAVLPLTVTPEVSLPNTFKNEEWIESSIYGSLRMLDINIKVPFKVVFGRRCVDFWVGKVCTGKFKWDGIDEDHGPVISNPKFWEMGGELSSGKFSTDKGWELQGLQTFPLQSFVIEPNSPPQLVSPVPDQVVHWNTNIDIDLDTVFSDPDAQALTYHVDGLPAFLHVQGSHLLGTVDRPYKGAIRIRAEDGSGGREYDSFELTVAMPVADLERPRLSLREETPSVPKVIDYRLSAQPSAAVTLDLTPDNDQIDLGSGFGMERQLAFDASNWDVRQSVSVTAKDDFVDEIDGDSGITALLSSTDAGFDGGRAEKIVVEIRDNDRAGIRANPYSLLTGEGGQSDTLRLRLTSEPVAPVTLSLTSGNGDEFSLGASSLSFDAGNWSTYQSVVVTGVEDSGVQDGTYEGLIHVVASSSDNLYDNRRRDVQARNTDNDKAGVTITPVSALRTTEADEGGADDSFRVVLDADPSLSGNVTVSFTVSDSTEGSVNPPSVVFDHSNWSVPQTVSLTGVNDTDADGDLEYTVETGISSSNAAGYATLEDSDVDDVFVTNIDDERSGFLIDPDSTHLQTGENGDSAVFAIRLRSIPEADVSVTVVSSNTDEGDVDKGELLFTVDNWATPQSVTLAGIDEDIVDGPKNYTVDISSSSADALYDGLVLNPPLSATNQDDDVAAVLVSPLNGLEVTETGAADQFSVVLAKQPETPVTLPVASQTVTAGQATPSSLVFTPDDWHQPQTVTVYGTNNLVDDGNRVFHVRVGRATTGPQAYQALPYTNVSVTNYAVDNAAIMMTATGSLSVSENGGKAHFSVRLATMPMTNIRLEFNLSDGSQGEVTPAFMEFTPENWDQPRIVTFTALDNHLIDGERVVDLDALVPAGSGIGSAYPPGTGSAAFSINIADEDAAGILVSPENDLYTSEAGDAASFRVVLLAQPSADVAIDVQSSDSGEGLPDRSSLTFTPFDWAVPQTVTVTGQNDDMADEDQAYEIRFQPAASSDTNYDGLVVSNVALTNLDDEEPGVTVTPNQNLVTTEDGGSAQFEVVLDTLPAGDVQLSLIVDSPEEASLSSRALTFNQTNWNIPQQVTITGVDDDVVDGDEEYSIIFGLIENAGISSYGSFEITPVKAINRDNDPVEVLVQEQDTGLRTDENGTEDRFSVALNATPTENVYMEIGVDRPDEALLVDEQTDAAMTTTTLIFTPDDWALPKQVLVRGVDDAIYDEDQAYNVIIKPLVSGDARYNGLDPVDPAGINEDNDYHPTGYIYYSGTGSLVRGGRVSVNCTNGKASIVSGRDGTEGYYQFVVNEINGLAACELNYTPPAGYSADTACLAENTTLSAPTTTSFTQLGSVKDDASGMLKDKTCSGNPWYRRFEIAPDAGKITNNNLPMTRGACTYEATTLQVSGSFSGAGSTILSSAQAIQTPDSGNNVKVLAPHLLVLKSPQFSVKSGALFKVERGAGLSVSQAVDLCQ